VPLLSGGRACGVSAETPPAARALDVAALAGRGSSPASLKSTNAAAKLAGRSPR